MKDALRGAPLATGKPVARASVQATLPGSTRVDKESTRAHCRGSGDVLVRA